MSVVIGHSRNLSVPPHGSMKQWARGLLMMPSRRAITASMPHSATTLYIASTFSLREPFSCKATSSAVFARKYLLIVSLYRKHHHSISKVTNLSSSSLSNIALMWTLLRIRPSFLCSRWFVLLHFNCEQMFSACAGAGRWQR